MPMIHNCSQRPSTHSYSINSPILEKIRIQNPRGSRSDMCAPAIRGKCMDEGGSIPSRKVKTQEITLDGATYCHQHHETRKPYQTQNVCLKALRYYLWNVGDSIRDVIRLGLFGVDFRIGASHVARYNDNAMFFVKGFAWSCLNLQLFLFVFDP